jgi:hypoxanthine phosphoribosyltransferase
MWAMTNGPSAMALGSLRGPARRASASDPVATVLAVAGETPVFQAYRGGEPPRFANRIELECAKVLDYYGIPWEYEPRTFVLDTDDEGRVTSAFTPDFYLPEQELYVEVTVMKQSLVTRKNRKLRELKRLYPDVNVKLFYRRDIERLAQRFRLRLAS